MKTMNYPKAILVRPEEKNSETVQINTEDLIKVEIDKLICVRRSPSEFNESGFYLVNNYNWQIVRDSEGAIVLVPTKKE